MIKSEIHHRSILRFLGLSLDPLCMVLEFMDMGTLFDYLHDQNNELDWKLRLSILRSTAEAMSFLHDQSFIHRGSLLFIDS